MQMLCIFYFFILFFFFCSLWQFFFFFLLSVTIFFFLLSVTIFFFFFFCSLWHFFFFLLSVTIFFYISLCNIKFFTHGLVGRYLIEGVTGLYTGSLYDDSSLTRKGEEHKSIRNKSIFLVRIRLFIFIRLIFYHGLLYTGLFIVATWGWFSCWDLEINMAFINTVCTWYYFPPIDDNLQKNSIYLLLRHDLYTWYNLQLFVIEIFPLKYLFKKSAPSCHDEEACSRVRHVFYA